MASPHLHHPSSLESLEGLIRLSSSPPLEHEERIRARSRFYEILNRYENRTNVLSNGQYSRTKLLQLTYEYAISEKSKDHVLRAFFNAIGLPMEEDGVGLSKEEEDGILPKLVGFADFLIDNFFLPLKASTGRTPQPSPAYHAAIQQAQANDQHFAGTSSRLKTLRGDCLVRDKHRCVISRKFDQTEAIERLTKSPHNARDDDSRSLIDEDIDYLEVAHILPHSLGKIDSLSELDDSRQAALSILNMFDCDVVHLINGPEIDRPRNALTLTTGLHRLFGAFELYFEPVDNAPNTYNIDMFLPYLVAGHAVPVTRTLFTTEERTIDPPSPRLLAVHRAIAHILHLSAAGDYIDKILRDIEDQSTRVDGSTSLGRLVQLRMAGWWDGRIGG